MDVREKIYRELAQPARRNFKKRCIVIKSLNDLYAVNK